MLTVLCVLKSGGEYDASWVEKLQRAVKRHLSVPHVFKCLSDVEVPCDRITLEHDWPGWWSKIEVFRPGVVTGPTLYLDLDTVLVGSIDRLSDLPYDFAMMRNLMNAYMPGSAVMWFRNPQTKVYDAFKDSPQEHISFFKQNAHDSYRGDQAFIWEVFDRKVNYFTDDIPGIIRSYRRHCMAGVPEGCSVVAFGGSMKPNTVKDQRIEEAWNVL